MSVSKSDANPNTTVAGPSSATAQPAVTTWRYERAKGLPALYQSCVSALQALRSNKMRSLLTSLGIIIGVGAVILMISISESSAASINQRLSGLSPNELIIRSGSTRSSGVNQGAGTQQTLSQGDADAISSQVANVAAVSPVVNASGQVVFRNQNWATSVQGVYPTYQQIGSWQLQEGTFFLSSDDQSVNSVAVIGQTVADNLFTPLGVDPIGQQIRIRIVPFTVIGVLSPKGASGFGNADDIIYVPFSTAQQRLTGNHNVNSIDVMADSSAQVNNVQNATQQLLEQLHHISNPLQDDFTIQNQSQVLQTVQSASQTLTILLVGIASVSLLVSVTERTRENGIRIAIGTRPRDVMTQFLIEALMLSALGGLVGIILGTSGALMYSLFSKSLFVLNPLSVLLAFGFAAAVGIVFGFYPAQRAARMDPIVALRAE